MIDLYMDPFVTTGVLIEFLRDQFRKKGFHDAVLGLSGGVDSAFGAAILAEALGPKHVIGLIMPSGESSKDSVTDAKEVARALGIRHALRHIGPVIEAFFAAQTGVDRMRIGNAAARTRMMTLFDYSKANHALVLGTSNKTELLLGYGTWFGDLACAINPIGDLYKTQVWQLSEFLGVPDRVITKAPTADLWAGQTDEGELGFTYEDVDQLLHMMVDREYSHDALVEAGFDRPFVEDVYRRIIGSQYKRSLPTIPKVSHKTIGIDFHLSRDWGS
jgi:NAD+ synthase